MESCNNRTMATQFRAQCPATLTIDGTYEEIRAISQALPSGIDVYFQLKLSVKKIDRAWEREEYIIPLVNYNDGRDSLKVLDSLHKQGRITVDEYNDISRAILELKKRMPDKSAHIDTAKSNSLID